MHGERTSKPVGLSDRLWKARYTYDAIEIFHKYQAIPNLVSGINFTGGPGPRSAHLPMSWFMYNHPSYSFAWVVEYDVRLIGHWGNFLDAAFNLAEWTPGDPWQMSDGSQKSPKMSYPDFVTFWHHEETERFKETRVGVEGTNMYSLLMVWGGSKELFHIMHEYSRQGQTAHLEIFPATIARHHGMRSVSIPHAIWTEGAGPDSYHCCGRGAPRLYTDWYHSGKCARLTLVHPVKLVEDFWPSA